MSESSENSEAHCAAETQRKLAQHHIERIKKEDEEEQWISGEELYTEGSSDEDDAALRAKRRGKVIRKNRRAIPSKDVKQKEPQPIADSAASLETPTTSKSSNHMDNPDAVLNTLISEPKLESLSLSDEDDNEEVVTKINKQSNWTLCDMLENVTESQKCMLSSEFEDSENEIFKKIEAFYISHAQSDQSRPQNEKSCNGVTSDLQSAFLEMEKYDNLLEFMTKKEREARETTNQLMRQTRNKLLELHGSQKVNAQLARNIKSFVQLHTEETNGQVNKPVTLPNLNGDKKKNFKAAALMDQSYTSRRQKQRVEAEERPSSTIGETKTRSVLTRRVQSAITPKKSEVNFIQRNIESVSANVEVVLTDVEKQRLAMLLKEIEGSSRKANVKRDETSVTDFRKKRSTDVKANLEPETAFVMLTQEENEKVKHLLEEKESNAKYKYSDSEHKLMDINKSLAALRTTALKEVDPVGEDEIKNLVAGYYKESPLSSQVSFKASSEVKNAKVDFSVESHPEGLQEEEQSTSNFTLDAETLQDLLNQAYKDLPNFKYKYKV